MKPELYYKHKELIDNIISVRLRGKIMLIDNELYVKMDNRIFKYNEHKSARYIFQDLNNILTIIDDDDFYFKMSIGFAHCSVLNPMDLYYYYNIKKLKEENNKIKELLKNKTD
jgi:hypothetical protein